MIIYLISSLRFTWKLWNITLFKNGCSKGNGRNHLTSSMVLWTCYYLIKTYLKVITTNLTIITSPWFSSLQYLNPYLPFCSNTSCLFLTSSNKAARPDISLAKFEISWVIEDMCVSKLATCTARVEICCFNPSALDASAAAENHTTQSVHLESIVYEIDIYIFFNEFSETYQLNTCIEIYACRGCFFFSDTFSRIESKVNLKKASEHILTANILHLNRQWHSWKTVYIKTHI